ncbi:septin-4-like protein [Anopheles sinensis]|uniref:Septin-4-like protein n=1 Tax=Anopheles sinensis TaxID=74873 RepID=A0A084VEY4_ANOSI|nr:septin-4-like protein [Anopheles sinensis]
MLHSGGSILPEDNSQQTSAVRLGGVPSDNPDFSSQARPLFVQKLSTIHGMFRVFSSEKHPSHTEALMRI